MSSQEHPNIDAYFDGVFRPNADGSGGLRVTKVEDERLTAEMTVEARHLNYMGGLHGGISATVRTAPCLHFCARPAGLPRSS